MCRTAIARFKKRRVSERSFADVLKYMQGGMPNVSTVFPLQPYTAVFQEPFADVAATLKAHETDDE